MLSEKVSAEEAKAAIDAASKEAILKVAKGYREIPEDDEAAGEPVVPANFDDLVFANRNREYGAYLLRRAYLKNVYVGVGVTALLTIVIFTLPYLTAFFGKSEPVAAPVLKKLVYTELSAPPPLDKIKPPPPQIQLPRLQKVIKFVPPKVVRETVVETVPTIEEIKANEVASVAVEGTEVVFDEPVEEIVVEDDNQIFTVVEQSPEFVGGYAAMVTFIKSRMVYPASARRMHLEGTVHVSFVVTKSGEIVDAKILRGISADIDKEALRVVALMPPWKPGRQNGHEVNVRFVMPLKFKL